MRSPKGIILTLVLFVGFVWWQSLDTKRKSDDSLEMAVAVVKSLPEYGRHQVFFDSRVAKFHQRAFGMAHKKGRLKSSFGETIYRTVLLTLFKNDAEAVGNTEVFDAMDRELLKIQQ